MSRKSQIALWLSFVLVALLTWFAYFRLSSAGPYVTTLLVLAGINFAQALWILIDSRFAWRTLGLVIVAFIIGQWWLFLWSAVLIGWSTRGFAP